MGLQWVDCAFCGGGVIAGRPCLNPDCPQYAQTPEPPGPPPFRPILGREADDKESRRRIDAVREVTGAQYWHARKALRQSAWDVDQAIDRLVRHSG